MQSHYRAQLRLELGAELFDSIPDRKPAPQPRPPVQRRPRIEARQRIILGGSVPAVIACGFTVAEISVLAVIAAEHKRHGRCDLTIGEIAYRAQCCRTVVQNTLRQAIRCGVIDVDHRRIARDRNLSNVVVIISRVWIAWLRLGPRTPRPWGKGGWPAASSNKGRAHESGRKPQGHTKRRWQPGWRGRSIDNPPER